MKLFLIIVSLVLLLISPAETMAGSYYSSNVKEIITRYSDETPREWGEYVEGVHTSLDAGDKVIALTFDACGTTAKSCGYDEALIRYLTDNDIPATLFISGKWIDANTDIFTQLSNNPLFEIANHGLMHRPCSVNGKSAYGLAGTKNVEEVVEEVELNAVKIAAITGTPPKKFYRSGTNYYDEVAVRIVADLGYQVVGYSVLGDAGAGYSREKVKHALIGAVPGSIVICHMNHPESETAEGVMAAIPELKAKGYRFVRLSEVSLN